MTKLKKMVTAFDIFRANNPTKTFHSPHYLRHNARRLEHLASLRIPVTGMSVLEVGAGIGDHSHYYIDRGCSITITEVRPDNLQYLRTRYPQNEVHFLDMENPVSLDNSPFDIVHCYGLLYHLENTEQALKFLSQSTKKILFLETCVSLGEDDELNLVPEKQRDRSQAFSGTGCRPTRLWLFKRLQDLFEYVYLPKTQPNHEEFPIDWADSKASLKRAVFIGSRIALENEMLTQSLPSYQTRHD